MQKTKITLILTFIVCFSINFIFSEDSLLSKTNHKKSLRIASEPDYPPFCIVNKKGEADGFSVDLIKAATKVMGIKIQIKVAPWNQIKQELLLESIDILPLVGRSPERENIFDFTFPYHTMKGAIFLRNEENSIAKIEDLKNKKIAVMEGDNAHEFLIRNNISKNIRITKTFTQAFRQLSKGKHDAIVAQKLMGLQLINKLKIKNIKVLDIRLNGFNQDFSFAVKKGNTKLLSLLNEGLSIIIANGTYDKIHKKWWTPLDNNKLSLFKILLTLMPFIIVIIIISIIIIIFVLKSQLKKRTYTLEMEVIKHKKAELALIESEAKYRTIIEHSGDAIAIRQKGKFEFANKAFLKMLDYSIIELVGIKNSLIFDSDILKDMANRFSKNDLNENLSIQFETMITKKDKTKIDVEIFEKIISYKEEKSQLVIVRDITKQKAIMKDLQRGAEQTKGLNEFIPICAGCSLIRDDEKENKPWVKPPEYINERLPEIQFSHGMCPDCMKKWYPDFKLGGK